MSNSQFRIFLVVSITGAMGWGFYELALAVANFGVKGPLLILSVIAYLTGLIFSLIGFIYFIKKLFHQS